MQGKTVLVKPGYYLATTATFGVHHVTSTTSSKMIVMFKDAFSDKYYMIGR